MNLYFKNGSMSRIQERHLVKTLEPVEFAQEIASRLEITQELIDDSIKFNLKSDSGTIHYFNTFEKEGTDIIQAGYLILDQDKNIVASLVI